MATTPEGAVKAVIKKWLDAHGAYYYMPVQNGMGRVGIPDFIVSFQGRFVGIEAKAPGKRGNVTANQKRELQMIQQSGGIAIIIDNPKQLTHLESMLNVSKTPVQEVDTEPERPN